MAFEVTDSEIATHRKRQLEKRVINKKLRDDNTSFLRAMLSDEADCVKQNLVKRDTLQRLFCEEGE